MMSDKKKLRRAVSGIMSLVIIAGGAGFGLPGNAFENLKASAAQTAYDLNSDGSVNSDDVKLMRNFLLNKKNEISSDANADFNGDSSVNVFDLIMLKRAAVSTYVSEINYIHLNSSYISVEGQGVELSSDNTIATITAGGTYYVDGTLTDGQIYVNAGDDDKVTIVLNGVDVTCSTNAPIYCVNADKTVITLAEGTKNVLTDTETYTDEEADSTIYSKDDLTINGSGSLTVNSNYLYSITSNDDLKINGGNITVKHNSVDSSGAAVKGKKSVEIKDGTLNITCAADDSDSGADGIISNDKTEDCGYVLISGGTVTVNSKGGDAVKSKKNYVEITGGKVTLKAENDAVQAETSLKISGSAEVYAYGKRGLTAGDGYTVDITGGTVVATSNEEFTNTDGITVNSMLLNYTEKLDKKQIDISKNGTTVLSVTPDKKYTYALICNSSLSAGTYQVYTDSIQMTHDAAASDGQFAVSAGTVNTFNNVKAMETTVTTTDSNTIVLSNSGITFTGTGASLSSDNKTITILSPGTYSVTGEMSDGQIVVDVDKTTYADGAVELSLEGATLSNSSDSPIYVAAIGDKCTITAKKGTVNTISDGSSAYTNSDDDAGAIYSKDDLTIKGKGTLNVNGNYQDGIVCKDDLKIYNGNVNVTAVDDGIRGKDSVRIGNPDDLTENGGSGDFSGLTLTVKTTGGDGIKSTNSSDDGKGYVVINGGTVNVNSYADGIQAEQEFTMNGGDVTIYTYQGSSYSGTSSSGWSSGYGGMGGGMNGGNSEGNSAKTDISAKGIKAVGLYDESGTTYQSGGNLIINAGTLNIDSSDDSLHCGGNMTVNGGTMTLASADDAMHSDNTLTIGADGTSGYDSPYIDITKCYEGVEGVDIVQNSGTVMVTSSDDGYNAAGGNDSSGNSGFGGWNQGGFSSSGNQTLVINGGYTYINAAGDGLDSNGTLTINGGYVFVSQTGGGNSPIDCDQTWSYNGGVVVAGGSSDMFSESIPASYSFLTTSSISAGTTVTFTDSTGTVIATMTFANSSSEMVMCSPSSSVTCYTGGTVSGAEYFSVSSANSNMKAGYGGTISGGSTLSSSSNGNGNGNQGNWNNWG